MNIYIANLSFNVNNQSSAQKAVKELNGIKVDGRSIKVSGAKPKECHSNVDLSSNRN
jgi:RNA recognition motif-containing protein